MHAIHSYGLSDRGNGEGDILMSNADLRAAASEFLNELSQLGHGAQCETDNYTSSAPCDCGLEAIKIKASNLVDAFGELILHRENTY